MLNTASTAAANGWAMIVTLVTVPLLLHGLGAEAFGVWVLLQAFSARNGWLSIADLGIGTSITHLVAGHAGTDDRGRARAVTRTALLLLFVVGVVGGIAMLAFGLTAFAPAFRVPHSLRNELHVAMVFFSIQIVFDLLLDGYTSALEGYQRVDASRLTDGVRRTLVAGATVAVAVGHHGLAPVAAASLAATVASTAVGAVLLGRETHGERATHDPGDRARLIAYAWRVAAVDASGVVKRSMDRVIVGALIGPAAVTLVEIATQVQNAANAILSAATYAVTSSSAWLRARGDNDTLRELLERGTRYSLLVTWPVAIVSGVLAGPLVALWVGHRYHEAAGLVIVALLPLASAPLQVGSNMLRGTGRVSRIIWPAVISTAVNLVASVVLVKRYGVVGVFVGTLVGTAILVPSLGRAVLSEYGISAVEFVRRGIVPVLVPVVALFVVTLGVHAVVPGNLATVVAAGGAGFVTYVVATLRFGLRPAETRELVGLLRRQPTPR